MRYHETKQKFIDPACGMSVDPNTAAGKICHNGVQIYFCAEGCKKTSDRFNYFYKVKT